jgi:hypothetical protein
VVNLLVGGVAMDGFCIDPYHFRSSSTLLYTWVATDSGTQAAWNDGRRSGALDFSAVGPGLHPTIGASAAAGLQIAIWEVIGGE